MTPTSPAADVTLSDVLAAQAILAGKLHRTPIIGSRIDARYVSTRPTMPIVMHRIAKPPRRIRPSV